MTKSNANHNDIAVIGGGHNGLVCAAYLAKAGRKVTVFEAADQVGGLAMTREFAPGFKASCAHLLYLLDERISKDLALSTHGLKMAKSSLDTIALDKDGQHITIGAENVEGGALSTDDRNAYREYRRFMSKFAAVVGSLHNRVPPRITHDRGDLISMARLALNIRMLGRDDMREFLRIAGINIHDILKENFENPLLKGALSLEAVLGTHSGPRSNNSVFTALHRLSGNNAGAAGAVSIPAGGMGAVTQALATAAEKHGADIRTSCPVSSILMKDDKVSGVQLESGEQFNTSCVISNADPRSTIMNLLGARHVEAGFAQKIGHVRIKANAAKLHIALDGLPGFKGLDQNQLGQRLVIAPTVEYVEQAFNHCKYGEYSTSPVAEITLPSIHDKSLAPDGQHVLSAVIQYAPRELREGWGSGKAAFTEQILDVLSIYAPDIRQRAVVTELLTPEDIEAEYRISGGHWHHGEMSLDQFLMMRPVPGAGQYKTPVDGLYLCSAGSHPGGGIMGSAGKNAASVVLGESK
jgi:phytoene dehydrogenase-like protein